MKLQFMPQGGPHRSNDIITSKAENIFLKNSENTQSTLKDKNANLKET